MSYTGSQYENACQLYFNKKYEKYMKEDTKLQRVVFHLDKVQNQTCLK